MEGVTHTMGVEGLRGAGTSSEGDEYDGGEGPAVDRADFDSTLARIRLNDPALTRSAIALPL